MKYIAYGIFNDKHNSQKRVGARIGGKVFDLVSLAQAGVLDTNLVKVFNSDSLNSFINQSPAVWDIVRSSMLQFASENDVPVYKEQTVSYVINEVNLFLPLKASGFTDFYTSISHATNVGKLFRPDNPLMPNWKHLPVAYNGRASSIVTSGHKLIRPRGQILNPTTNLPEYKECQKLDFEVELGVVMGGGNEIGHPIKVNDAHNYVFGVCILNDWSARDIQSWEYQPLGPFNSKGFLTSISPWIVPISELDEFKVKLPAQDPQPLGYLQRKDDYLYDIQFEVSLKTPANPEGAIICTTNFNTMYWSINQWIAHHTVAGTNLAPCDILGSGTISDFTEGSYGSLLELTKNGKEPLRLPNGETRTFLQDGDELTIHAYCGAHKLEIGSVTTQVCSALDTGC